MEWNELYPKITQPSTENMADFIGGNGKKLWTSLLDYAQSAYGVKPKLFYSGCSGKPGWNIKLQKSGQSFGTLYPEKGFFTVFIVISYKLDGMMDMLKDELSLEMRELYAAAQDYMKMGKWMMFPVQSETDLKDYKTLMAAKMQPK